jgi:hypothetical protein
LAKTLGPRVSDKLGVEWLEYGAQHVDDQAWPTLLANFGPFSPHLALYLAMLGQCSIKSPHISHSNFLDNPAKYIATLCNLLVGYSPGEISIHVLKNAMLGGGFCCISK